MKQSIPYQINETINNTKNNILNVIKFLFSHTIIVTILLFSSILLGLYIKNVLIPHNNDSRNLQLGIVQVQQWLTDISATRAKEGYDDGFKEAQEWSNKVNLLIDHYIENATSSKVQFYKDFKKSFENFYKMGIEMANAYIKDGPEGGNPMMEKFDPFAESLSNKLNIILEDTKKQFNLFNTINFILNIFIIIYLIAIIVIVKRKLNKANSTDKNLLKSVNDTLNQMHSNLGKTIETFSKIAQSLKKYSEETSQSAISQSAAVEEISSSAEELSTILRASSENAENSKHEIEICINEVSEGEQIGQSMSEKMQELSVNSESLSEVIQIIKTISEKITIINSIVMKTELLSFNASIEAARAGEHGKGFSVVADEVGSLARISGEAATDINEIIDNSNQKVSQTIKTINSNIEDNEKIVNATTKSFNVINEDVLRLGQIIDEFIRNFQEQEVGVKQILEALLDINKSMLSVKKNSIETSSTAESLIDNLVEVQSAVNNLENLMLSENELEQLMRE